MKFKIQFLSHGQVFRVFSSMQDVLLLISSLYDAKFTMSSSQSQISRCAKTQINKLGLCNPQQTIKEVRKKKKTHLILRWILRRIKIKKILHWNIKVELLNTEQKNKILKAGRKKKTNYILLNLEGKNSKTYVFYSIYSKN